jgi:RNA recognition motif-containing protein
VADTDRDAYSGLAWHTEETTLRQKFEEFGVVEEAVCFVVLHFYSIGFKPGVVSFSPSQSTLSSPMFDQPIPRIGCSNTCLLPQ